MGNFILNKIKDEEYQNLISMVKMGVDLGILEKIDDTKMKNLKLFKPIPA